MLARYQPSPVVTLNRAVAVAKAEDASVGLALLETIANSPAMRDYPPFHGARAAMLEELGDVTGARTAYTRARALAPTASERAHFDKRLGALP